MVIPHSLAERDNCVGIRSSRTASSGTKHQGVPRTLLKKTGSAASAFDLRLTERQISHPVGVPTISSSMPSLIPQKITSSNLCSAEPFSWEPLGTEQSHPMLQEGI